MNITDNIYSFYEKEFDFTRKKYEFDFFFCLEEMNK